MITIGEEEARTLLRFARARIAQELGGDVAEPPDTPAGRQPGGCFVTLRWPDGRLQGCVGTLEATAPLVVHVGRTAVGAALHDPRAEPLTPADVAALEIELSVLSPLEALTVRDEAEACARLAPGRDGVVLRWSGHHATFLPQMWERFPEPLRFLGELKEKAGLPRDFWAADLEVWCYTVTAFVDP